MHAILIVCHVLGLQKYHEYNISISAATKEGQGPFSPQIIGWTLEDGMTLYDHFAQYTAHYQQYTVPDTPRELSAKVVNGSSVIVTWNPPLNENGILLGYQVTYRGEEVSNL